MSYKRLVLSSGSLKGFQYVGVLRALEEKNLVAQIQEYVGVSIGSLFSLFMILNFTSNEIEKLLLELDLKALMYPNILQLTDIYGIIDPSGIINLIKDMLAKKNVSPDITMHGLYQRYQKTLIVYTTMLGDEHRGIALTHESHPELEVWRAVLMSISIPFIFPPVRYNSNLYIDGAIKNNFPIDRYDIDETLGCNLLDLVGAEDTFGNYVQRVYSSIYSNVEDDEKYNIINLKVCLSTLVFFLDNDTKQMLFKAGYDQTIQWFQEKELYNSNGNAGVHS